MGRKHAHCWTSVEKGGKRLFLALSIRLAVGCINSNPGKATITCPSLASYGICSENVGPQTGKNMHLP